MKYEGNLNSFSTQSKHYKALLQKIIMTSIILPSNIIDTKERTPSKCTHQSVFDCTEDCLDFQSIPFDTHVKCSHTSIFDCDKKCVAPHPPCEFLCCSSEPSPSSNQGDDQNIYAEIEPPKKNVQRFQEVVLEYILYCCKKGVHPADENEWPRDVVDEMDLTVGLLYLIRFSNIFGNKSQLPFYDLARLAQKIDNASMIEEITKGELMCYDFASTSDGKMEFILWSPRSMIEYRIVFSNK
jgi:hypothetical protein